MCFLGSTTYPLENTYKKIISAGSGSSNASTSMSKTCYKFSVDSKTLVTVLPVFANFFIEPTFTADGTGREVQAVSSEDSKNRTSDARRRLQVLKSLCRAGSTFKNFSTGNEGTILGERGVDIAREGLKVFHGMHYRGETMKCVLHGPQSLDELEKMAVELFERVPNERGGVGEGEVWREVEEARGRAEERHMKSR